MTTSTNITSLIKLSMCELQHAITWNWLTLTRSSCRCSIPESLKILRKQKTSVKWIHGRERFLLWELRDVTSGSWICERIINAEGLGATVCFRKWQQTHLQPFAAAADSQTRREVENFTDAQFTHVTCCWCWIQTGLYGTFHNKTRPFHPSSSISQDDDFVFEDFARLRLKGVVDDKDEDC